MLMLILFARSSLSSLQTIYVIAGIENAIVSPLFSNVNELALAPCKLWLRF